MKYIKTYELNDTSYNYNIGDIVLLDLDSIQKTNTISINFPTDEIAKIIKLYHDPFKYIINFPKASNGEGVFYITEDNIIRKATPDDMEKFESKKLAIKFNIWNIYNYLKILN